MRIKKFNELFDSEEVKVKNEIPMMQGFMKGVSSKTINRFSKESLNDFGERFIYSFPVLYQFTDRVQTKYNSVIFEQKNDQWYVSITIAIEEDKYGLGIFYKHIEATSPKNGKDPLLKRGLDFRGKEYSYYSEWNDIEFSDMVKLTKSNFIPLIDRLGFKEEISKGKKISIQRFN